MAGFCSSASSPTPPCALLADFYSAAVGSSAPAARWRRASRTSIAMVQRISVARDDLARFEDLRRPRSSGLAAGEEARSPRGEIGVSPPRLRRLHGQSADA